MKNDNNSREINASICNNLAILYARIGSYDKAFNYFKKAIILRENINKEDSNLINNYYNISKLYAKENNYVMAISYYLKRIKLLEKIVKTDNSLTNTLINSYDNIAGLYVKNNDYDNGIKYYLKEKNYLKKTLYNIDKTINVYQNIIDTYILMCDSQNVITYYLKLIKLLENETDNKYKSILAHSYMMLGNYYNYIKEYSLAKKYYLANIKIREESNHQSPYDDNFLMISYIHLLSLYSREEDRENTRLMKSKLDKITKNI